MTHRAVVDDAGNQRPLGFIAGRKQLHPRRHAVKLEESLDDLLALVLKISKRGAHEDLESTIHLKNLLGAANYRVYCQDSGSVLA
jgi:hypothetical protein